MNTTRILTLIVMYYAKENAHLYVRKVMFVKHHKVIILQPINQFILTVMAIISTLGNTDITSIRRMWPDRSYTTGGLQSLLFLPAGFVYYSRPLPCMTVTRRKSKNQELCKKNRIKKLKSFTK